MIAQLTLAAHVFVETLHTVDGCVGEDVHALAAEEHVEDVEHCSHVTLARLVHLLARRQPDAHGSQRREQRSPARVDVTRAGFNQLTDAADDLKTHTPS